jgi:DNA-directed RNA polymerase specialized sigma24 family protein
LANVDENAKRAFELFWLHEMTANEIAKSMRMQIEAVENIIDDITFSIVSKLKIKMYEKDRNNSSVQPKCAIAYWGFY